MDWPTILDFGLKVLAIIVIPTFGWVLRELGRYRTRLAELQIRVQACESRIEALNEAIARTPSTAELHALVLSVERLSGQVGVISERMTGQQKLYDRIENVLSRQEAFLLNHRTLAP